MHGPKGAGRSESVNRAFTLLEVVIAMLLLGVGLLALMALQIRSIRSNAFGNCMTVASCVAQNEIEDLRTRPWGDITDGTTTEMVSDKDPETGETRMAFTRQRSVQTDIYGRMKDVIVTVSWEQYGRPHQIVVSTKIARRQ